MKALSDEQIADLKAGRGMSLALPAELNGYPGPAHVVELADRLDLSVAQKAKARELFAAMKAETVPLGEQLITQEQHLDGLFASKTVTPTSLEAASAAIGTTQGKLRGAHLKYHLAMIAELTPARRYADMRTPLLSRTGTAIRPQNNMRLRASMEAARIHRLLPFSGLLRRSLN